VIIEWSYNKLVSDEKIEWIEFMSSVRLRESGISVKGLRKVIDLVCENNG